MTTFEDSWDHVPRNLALIRASVREAAERADRDPAGVELVAVSKTVPSAGLRAAIAADQRLFGENRVQEAIPKIEALSPEGGQFHLVGHLQTNKARHASLFDMVESIDSVRVATTVSRRLEETLPVLLEVNMAGEENKSGFAADEVKAALAEIRALPHLDVRGLMTIAPLVVDPEEARPHFRGLRQLGETLGLAALSMGMTNDYRVAIEEGATIVRIGRAIFGDR